MKLVLALIRHCDVLLWKRLAVLRYICTANAFAYLYNRLSICKCTSSATFLHTAYAVHAAGLKLTHCCMYKYSVASAVAYQITASYSVERTFL
jgi:hypothetical protein